MVPSITVPSSYTEHRDLMPWRKSHPSKLSNRRHHMVLLWCFPSTLQKDSLLFFQSLQVTYNSHVRCLSLSSTAFCLFLGWWPWAASPYTSPLFPQLSFHSITPSRVLELWRSKEVTCLVISSYSIWEALRRIQKDPYKDKYLWCNQERRETICMT